MANLYYLFHQQLLIDFSRHIVLVYVELYLIQSTCSESPQILRDLVLKTLKLYFYSKQIGFHVFILKKMLCFLDLVPLIKIPLNFL